MGDNDFSSLEENLSSNSSTANKNKKFDDTLEELERIQSSLGYAWGVTGHLNAVKNSDELRDAYNKAQPDVIKAFTKFSQSKPLYDVLDNGLVDVLEEPKTFEDMQK